MALFCNVTAVFNGYTFTEVTAARVSIGGDHVTHSADLSHWLSFQSMQRKAVYITLINDDAKPSTAGNGVTPGATGTLTVTMKTADGGSDRVYSGSAMCIAADVGTAHAEVGAANAWTFCLVSSNGTTTPLTTNS